MLYEHQIMLLCYDVVQTHTVLMLILLLVLFLLHSTFQYDVIIVLYIIWLCVTLYKRFIIKLCEQCF